MNINPFIEKTTKNWQKKIVCFVLAAMIYFFHQVSLLDMKTFSIPLQVKSDGNTALLSGTEKYRYVKVKVRTRRDQIASLTENDFSAYVDISSWQKDGTFSFPVYVVLDERINSLNLEPLEIYNQPDNIQLSVEKKVTKSVAVKADVEGTVQHGFKALSPSVEPAFVEVSGPASMVEKITELKTTVVDISQASEKVSGKAQILNVNSYVSVLGGGKISVEVPVVAAGMVKEFRGFDVTAKNLAENLEISGGLDKIDLTLSGNVLDIEKLSAKDVSVTVDCAEISGAGEFVLSVQIEIPRIFELSYQSFSSLTVKIQEKAEIQDETQNSAEEKSQGNSENISDASVHISAR